MKKVCVQYVPKIRPEKMIVNFSTFFHVSCVIFTFQVLEENSTSLLAMQ